MLQTPGKYNNACTVCLRVKERGFRKKIKEKRKSFVILLITQSVKQT